MHETLNSQIVRHGQIGKSSFDQLGDLTGTLSSRLAQDWHYLVFHLISREFHHRRDLFAQRTYLILRRTYCDLSRENGGNTLFRKPLSSGFNCLNSLSADRTIYMELHPPTHTARRVVQAPAIEPDRPVIAKVDPSHVISI